MSDTGEVALEPPPVGTMPVGRVVSKGHIDVLDLLRTLAALGVLCFHTVLIKPWPEGSWLFGMGLIRGGWVGVDLFFVMSGLVVGLSAFRGWSTQGKRHIPGFLLRRAMRIVPLYLLTCVVYVAMLHPQMAFRDDRWWQLVSHLTFTHNLWPDTIMAVNPPTWSLANEMQLYVLLLLFTPLLVSCRARTIAVLALVTALAYRSSVVLLACAHQACDDFPWLQHKAYLAPGMIDSFGLGVAMAVASLDQRMPRRGSIVWTGVALLSGVGVFTMGSVVLESASSGTIWGLPVWAVAMRSVVALLVAILVWSLIRQPAAHWVRGRVIRHLGNLSYGIYLWHAVVLEALLSHTALSGWALLSCVVAMTLALSEMSWHLLEKPLIAWAKRRTSQGTQTGHPMELSHQLGSDSLKVSS